jgi:hypothetical protein
MLRTSVEYIVGTKVVIYMFECKIIFKSREMSKIR